MKKIILILILVLLSGCSKESQDKVIQNTKSFINTKETLSNEVKVWLQERFDSDERFSKYHMQVKSVTLVKESNNKFKGIADIEYKNKVYQVVVNVTQDNDNSIFEVENGAFLFLMSDVVDELMNNLK